MAIGNPINLGEFMSKHQAGASYSVSRPKVDYKEKEIEYGNAQEISYTSRLKGYSFN